MAYWFGRFLFLGLCFIKFLRSNMHWLAGFWMPDSWHSCKQIPGLWCPWVSFGMPGASTLASCGTLGRSWDDPGTLPGPSWDEGGSESMITKTLFLVVRVLSMFSTNHVCFWVRRHLALFIGLKRAPQSTGSLASGVNVDFFCVHQVLPAPPHCAASLGNGFTSPSRCF